MKTKGLVKAMIEINNVVKKYNENKPNECVAIKGISLRIESGEMVAIMGKSGCGKSTLLHMLAGIDLPTSGEIIIDGKATSNLTDKDLSKFRRENIGIVLQDFMLIEELSVIENVLVPLNFTEMKKSEKKSLAVNMIYKVDLEKYVNKPVSQLSGGEKQRVAIARALVSDASIILADEPTGSLDEVNSKAIMQMLLSINKKLGKTVIVVTHDKDVAAQCDRIIFISDGIISTSLDGNKELDSESSSDSTVLDSESSSDNTVLDSKTSSDNKQLDNESSSDKKELDSEN